MGFDALITLREPGRKRMGSRPVDNLHWDWEPSRKSMGSRPADNLHWESLVGRAWDLGPQITYIERA